MRFRLVFLALAFCVVLAGAVYAQTGIQRVTGINITFSSTNEAFDFEFESNAVEICTAAGSGTVYARFGVALTALEGRDTSVTEWATSSTIFQTGNSRLAGRALVFSRHTGQTDTDCRIYPFRTRGMVFNTNTASTASLDVNVFSYR